MPLRSLTRPKKAKHGESKSKYIFNGHLNVLTRHFHPGAGGPHRAFEPLKPMAGGWLVLLAGLLAFCLF